MLNFQQKENILLKHLEILKKCSLFEEIDDESLIKMLNCLGARILNFDKKFTVFSEGSSAKYIGIVLSGSVQSVLIDYEGNRTIVSNTEASKVFAEDYACAEIASIPVSIVANEPSEIMLIDCSHILHTCSNNCGFHQQLIYNLLKELAGKTLSFHQKVEITSKRTTREKLMTYLSMEAKKHSSNSFEIPFDRQELADYLEVDRSGLSAEISKLRNEGVLESHKKHFKLL